MMELTYYSLWPGKSSIVQDGTKITLENLLNTYGSLNENITNKNIFQYDYFPSIVKEPNYELFGSIIHAISGFYPEIQDIKKFKSVYNLLKKKAKEESILHIFNPNFVYCSLPYLFIGFNVSDKISGVGCDSVNDVYNFYEIIKKISLEKEIKVSSFLCGHRQSREIGFADSLIEEVEFSNIRKVTNLINGIFSNSENIENVNFTFYQPTGTIYGPLALFPKIFLNYAKLGLLGDLFLKLDEHYENTKEYLKLQEKSNVKFYVKSIDNHLEEMFKYAKNNFGENWQNMSNTDFEKLAGNEFVLGENKIAEIAYYMTKDEVIRFMPYYEEPEILSNEIIEKNINRSILISNKNPDLVSKVKNSINIFQKAMTISGKSLYETMFYYIWGYKAGLNDEIAFGFDTDHSRFQTSSWSTGFLNGRNSNSFSDGSPIIYSKKNVSSTKNLSLNNMSFRQFWR